MSLRRFRFGKIICKLVPSISSVTSNMLNDQTLVSKSPALKV
jgi:hypothetical protein